MNVFPKVWFKLNGAEDRPQRRESDDTRYGRTYKLQEYFVSQIAIGNPACCACLFYEIFISEKPRMGAGSVSRGSIRSGKSYPLIFDTQTRSGCLGDDPYRRGILIPAQRADDKAKKVRG